MSQGSSIFVNKPVGSACSPRDSRQRKQGGTQANQSTWRDDALAADVHIFFAEIDFLVDPGSHLTEEEREFTRSMGKKRRREYLAGRILLRSALGFLFGPPRAEGG